VHLNPRTTSGPADAGFTLIEVLVSLAVLAVGLLGLASLVLGGLQDTRSALQHTIATALLNDMADHIRANRSAAADYALAAGTDLDPPAASCAAPGECSPPLLAALDLYRWQNAAKAALPEAQASIVVSADASGAHACAIALQWRQPGETALATAKVTVLV
jgi:type IV pilus assembly protein PilV